MMRLGYSGYFHALQPVSYTHLDVYKRQRYGDLPDTVINLCKLGKVKVLGKKLQIVSIIQKADYIEVKFADEHHVSGENLLSLLEHWKDKVAFVNKKFFAIKLHTAGLDTKDYSRTDMLISMLSELERNVNKQS